MAEMSGVVGGDAADIDGGGLPGSVSRTLPEAESYSESGTALPGICGTEIDDQESTD